MAVISLTVIADGVAELRETVTVALKDVTTVGLLDLRQAAVIDRQRAQALLTILPNGSPYGVIGWHLDSQFTMTQEPESKSLCFSTPREYLAELSKKCMFKSLFFVTQQFKFYPHLLCFAVGGLFANVQLQ